MKSYENNTSPMVMTKIRLLSLFPWYGVLIQHLDIEEKDEKFFEDNGFPGKVIGVDGMKIYYNREVFDKLPAKQQIFLVSQQVVRCALFHFSRQGSRELKRWNTAGVIVANGMLLEDSVGEKPSTEPWLSEMKDLSAEQVYLKLQDMSEEKQDKLAGGMGCVMPQQPKGNGQEDAEGQGDAIGDALNDGDGNGKPSNQPSNQQLETNWKIAMEGASLAMKKRGLTSAGMDRSLNVSRKSKNDWRERIRQLMVINGDHTWSRPNKRLVGKGLYLPSIKKSKHGHLIFACDTSGSIDEVMLSKFAGEINEILGCCDEWPERVTVLMADARVCSAEDQEGELVLNPKGGGGTAFQPTFDYIKENEWEPQILFYLTDLCGDSPKQPDGYPVVWITPDRYKEYFGKENGVNFGELVVFEDD
jgi:predicted metal-dependent peptidase